MPQDVRLVRAVHAPTGRGPGNGMFALQRALRAAKPAWLHIGGTLLDGELPWFWSWEDRATACACQDANVPFVMGPNMLFTDWQRPFLVSGERELCNAAACRLQFTESVWYRNWILQHSGPAMQAPIILWPYPIDPLPLGPLPPENDMLLYEKSGVPPGLIEQLMQRWPNTVRIRYGSFTRQHLWAIARRSRACVYLSDNDRGPLALAEILLTGCPAVGVLRGAPWIEAGRTGEHVAALDDSLICKAIERIISLDRCAVRAAAQERFDTAAIVQTVLKALDAARD